MRISDWSSDVCSSDLDRFGIPVLRFAFRWSQHELNQVAHGQRTAHAVFKRMNATILDPELPPEKLITAGGEIIHELGTARMGPDPRSSVVDSYGQTWEVGNLVLMDGAIFASGAQDRKRTRLNSSHYCASRMPSSA